MTRTHWLVLITFAALCLLNAGCAGPKQFAAPSAEALNRQQAELTALVKQGRAGATRAALRFAKASEANRQATVLQSKEAVLTGELKLSLTALRTKITDVALRAEVDAFGVKLDELAGLDRETSGAVAVTGAELDGGSKELTEAVGHLVKADAAADAINTSFGPEYQTAVAKTVNGANAEILAQKEHADREAHAKWIWFFSTVALGLALAGVLYFKR